MPVIQLSGLSEAQRAALVVADWNLEMLGLELADLQSLGFDLALIGFDADEIASLTRRHLRPLGQRGIGLPANSNGLNGLSC